MKKIRTFGLLLAALLLLSGCGAAQTREAAGQCSISISCRTLADAPEKCKADTRELIPADGWILPEETAVFYEGESVFDVLLRETKNHKIHMEYSQTPLYQAAYLEGIGNLYEFDAGETSGWMYSVNGWFPNYGCSQYQLKDGDKIAWVYTCDLGQDVGGGDAAGAQQ